MSLAPNSPSSNYPPLGLAAKPDPGADFVYKRREPENALLYRILAEYLETRLAERAADDSRSSLPSFVIDTLRGFLKCGVLAYGPTLVECPHCKAITPLAFSCKMRGIGPSCAAKRMSETTIHLMENVLPQVPCRQWVITFPYGVRFWLATSRKLTSVVHGIVIKMISMYYQAKAEERGIENAVPGSVSFIQRFGSALNLNLHVHAIFIEGVYAMSDGAPVFYHLPGPEDIEVAQIVEAISNPTIAALRTMGYVSEDGTPVDRPEAIDKVFADSEQLTATAHASNQMRIAFGERAGEKVRLLGQKVHRIGGGCGYDEEEAFIKSRRCATKNNFCVHADRYIGQQERTKLKDLIDYAGRPAFSHERLSLRDPEKSDGDLVYTLKRAWSNGATSVVLSRSELLEKLVALVPPPNMHMTLYSGVLSSAHCWRSLIVQKPNIKKGFIAPPDGVGDPIRLSWSMLLKKTFKIDITRCIVCGGRIRPLACRAITMPEIITSLLRAMGLSHHSPPITPTRYTRRGFDFDQRHEDDVVQSCPDEVDQRCEYEFDQRVAGDDL